MKLSHIDTEQSNKATARIDRAPTIEILRLINEEDKKVALAVERVLPDIETSVDLIYGQLVSGGRLIYIGCGTSGRLGVLDAVECPPTYGVAPELVMGLIAGGQDAFVKAKEGAEDDAAQGAADLQGVAFSKKDALVGIAASGRTPYVIGAMDYAKSLGAPVIALTCCRDSELSRHADQTIAPLCGPEVVTGSTRMKSGTAEKLVLNMISTSVMIKLGKVYGNLMVDVKASNEKLRQRAVNIVMQATDADEQTAAQAIRDCDGRCKAAIVSIACRLSPKESFAALAEADGHISRVMERFGAAEA